MRTVLQEDDLGRTVQEEGQQSLGSLEPQAPQCPETTRGAGSADCGSAALEQSRRLRIPASSS